LGREPSHREKSPEVHGGEDREVFIFEGREGEPRRETLFGRDQWRESLRG